MLAAGSSESSLAIVWREMPKCWAAARWLLPWIKTQVRNSSRSVTEYTFLSLRSLDFSFKYSGVLGSVAHFCSSEWLSLIIAFTPVLDVQSPQLRFIVIIGEGRWNCLVPGR